MIAQDVMTRQPTTIAAGEPIARAAQLMAQLDVGALPVVNNYEDSRLVGIITDRDIVIRHDAKGGSRDCCVSDHMTSGDLRVTNPAADVHEVTRIMSRDQIRRMPVVDDRGRVVGVIAQADIARHLGATEPALVGNVVEAISTPHTLQMPGSV